MRFENIQCLKSGELKIKPNKLNVKYSYNGFGKTSLAKAIYYSIYHNTDEFLKLAPFDGGLPKIEGLDMFSSCMLFDNKFIDETLFQDSVLINDSYDVFIYNDELKKIEYELDRLLKSLINNCNNDSINRFLADTSKPLNELRINIRGDNFDGRSTGGRGFSTSSNIETLASKTSVKNFKGVLTKSDIKEWLNWHSEGHKFIHDGVCPFCNLKLKNKFWEYKNDISEIVNNIDFKKNNEARKYLKMLLPYFTQKQKDNANKFLSEATIDANKKSLLIESIKLVAGEIDKINVLRVLKEPVSDVDGTELLNKLNLCKLNTRYFSCLGEEFKKITNAINKSIKNIITKKDQLVECFNKQKMIIDESISNSKNEINDFLSVCGIPYYFDLVFSNGETKTRLLPIKNKNYDCDVIEHLSYGEKNVLSVALFGAMAKKTECDLIILDDPISSFDENKKFALMHYLFNSSNGVLCNTTCILFTHDFEPIVNVANSVVDTDNKYFVSVLTKNKGIVRDSEIKKSKLINAYLRECELAKNKNLDQYIRLVHLRNKYEIEKGAKGAPYDILSSAEHLRNKPSDKQEKEYEEEYISEGVKYICECIENFDYKMFIQNHSLKRMIELYINETDPISKLILFRGIDNKASLNNETELPVLFNMITSNFHVENMYLYSIKGLSTIPEYFIDLCDKLVIDLKNGIKES